ncbi:unknown [Bacteroides sp. CAG:1076]|jgi:hypothetical protein|nr:unknown [Bacteroides sp. CAG:1076]
MYFVEIYIRFFLYVRYFVLVLLFVHFISEGKIGVKRVFLQNIFLM